MKKVERQRPLSGSSRPSLDALALGISTVLSQLLMAVFLWLGAQSASVSAFGHFLALVALATMASALADFGSNSAWIVKYSRGEISLHEWCHLAFSKLTLSISIVIFLAPIQLLVGLDYWRISYLAVGLLFQQTLFSFFKVLDLNLYLAVVTLMDRVAVCLLFAIVQFSAQHQLGLWLVQGIGPWSTAVLSYFMLRRKGLFRSTSVVLINPWRKNLAFGIQSAAFASRNFDIALVGALSPISAGIYGAVVKWIQPLYTTGTIFALVTTPLVAGLSDRRQTLGPLVKAAWLPAFGVCSAFAISLFAKPMVDFLLGRRYSDSAAVLQVMAPGAAFWILVFISTSWLQALMDQKFVALVSSISALLSIVALCLLVPFFGYFIAAWIYTLFQLGNFLILSFRLIPKLKAHLNE